MSGSDSCRLHLPVESVACGDWATLFFPWSCCMRTVGVWHWIEGQGILHREDQHPARSGHTFGGTLHEARSAMFSSLHLQRSKMYPPGSQATRWVGDLAACSGNSMSTAADTSGWGGHPNAADLHRGGPP